jgi:MFS family permease
MTTLILWLWGISGVIGLLPTIWWGDLSSPQKKLDQFEQSDIRKARIWTLLLFALSFALCGYLCNQKVIWRYFALVHIAVFILGFLWSRSTPSKKFDPSAHTPSGRLK